MISMRKKHIFSSLIALGCIAALTSCRQQAEVAPEHVAVPVQVRTPAVVERAESVSASGSVEGSETADVAFLVGGRVARVLVEEGQHVSKGQLLAEIEPTDYRNAFNAATGQKEAAQAVAQKAEAGLRKQELEQARIDFERWQDEYKRMKFLVERKSLPPNDFQKIEAAYNASRRSSAFPLIHTSQIGKTPGQGKTVVTLEGALAGNISPPLTVHEDSS
jgi:multidrug efflux pump subunit AcrA (membrane-fusion protein)